MRKLKHAFWICNKVDICSKKRGEDGIPCEHSIPHKVDGCTDKYDCTWVQPIRYGGEFPPRVFCMCERITT